MPQNQNLILVVLGFGLVAALLGLLAGWAYALVGLLVATLCVGGVAVAGFVAQKADAPFASDGNAPAGDTTQHSNVSSAVAHAPR